MEEVGLKEKYQRFMRGRNGIDAYSQFLSIFAVVFILLGLVLRGGRWLSLVAVAVIGYSYYRTFSRNLAARSRENAAYLRKRGVLRSGVMSAKRRLFGTKTHRYFRCEQCGTELRVPRKKGKIKVRCPKCKHEMIKRT